MSISTRYYRHSGKFNLAGPIVIIILGGIVTPVLSFIYAYAIHHIPFIFINGLLTLGLGMLAGAARADRRQNRQDPPYDFAGVIRPDVRIARRIS
ncbi:MAG TPA: hypothetical protein VFX02_06325 [Gammaproteobacteria bacterium]|nr:hypothetical protein [Gammaproteobacteria bacterium]